MRRRPAGGRRAADDRLQGAGRRGCPTLLGLGPGDTVVIPSVCYPTYEVGARLAGADGGPLRLAGRARPGDRVRLVWVNSPGNPTAGCCPPTHLRKVVDWARERGAVVASDECYLRAGLGGRAGLGPVRSATATSTGVLAVHSLSKRSNLAGYRAGFVAGDPAWSASCWRCASTPG